MGGQWTDVQFVPEHGHRLSITATNTLYSLMATVQEHLGEPLLKCSWITPLKIQGQLSALYMPKPADGLNHVNQSTPAFNAVALQFN